MSVNAVGVCGNIMAASDGIVQFISVTCICDTAHIHCVNNFFGASIPSFENSVDPDQLAFDKAS